MRSLRSTAPVFVPMVRDLPGDRLIRELADSLERSASEQAETMHGPASDAVRLPACGLFCPYCAGGSACAFHKPLAQQRWAVLDAQVDGAPTCCIVSGKTELQAQATVGTDSTMDLKTTGPSRHPSEIVPHNRSDVFNISPDVSAESSQCPMEDSLAAKLDGLVEDSQRIDLQMEAIGCSHSNDERRAKSSAELWLSNGLKQDRVDEMLAGIKHREDVAVANVSRVGCFQQDALKKFGHGLGHGLRSTLSATHRAQVRCQSSSLLEAL